MKVKTADLSGSPLDWAVAKAFGKPLTYRGRLWVTNGEETVEYAPWAIHKAINGSGPYVPSLCHRTFSPSTTGDTVIDIMEQEGGFSIKNWLESSPATKYEAHIHNYDGDWIEFGPTLRIAVCRCFVASKLGDEVDIPEELMK